jgi:hypothetical protein
MANKSADEPLKDNSLKETLMDLARRESPAEALAQQISEQAEIGQTWSLSQARKAAISLSEKMPEDRPERTALQRMARAWHRRVARRTIRQSNLNDPLQVARLIAQWGHPKRVCVRLTDEIDEARSEALEGETLGETLKLPGDHPIGRAREAARRLEAFASGEIPDGIAKIGEVLRDNLQLKCPVVATDGPDITLSFLTNDRLTDHATA